MKSYNVVEYGETSRYLQVYVAAGDFMQFGLVDVVSKSVTKLTLYDTRIPGQRAAFLRCSINCVRYIATIARFAPSVSQAAFAQLGRITLYIDYVKKSIQSTDTAPTALYILLASGEGPCCTIV
jgi:hypothetical protein